MTNINTDLLELSSPLRLDHLPAVAFVIRKMCVASLIDERVPPDPRSVVSHGECVVVLLLAVFAGVHGLWRIREYLSAYDMPLIMGDPGFSLDPFHDDRLGKALDSLYEFGLDSLMTDVAVRVIEAFALDTRWQSFDTTSLSFYGDYSNEEGSDVVEEKEGSVGEDLDAAPRVVHGYAKNKRFDLKQILYGALVTHDGGVPLFGKGMSGNKSDQSASALFMGSVRELVKDPKEVIFVGDCKTWCPRVLEQSLATGVRVMSRLERKTKLSKQLISNPPVATSSVLIDYQKKHKSWDYKTIAGSDETYTYTIKDKNDKTIERKIPVRTVVCFSSKLYRQKEITYKKREAKENKLAKKNIKGWEKNHYACHEDAEKELTRLIKKDKSKTLNLSGKIINFEEKNKHDKPGRPAKNAPEPKTTTTYKLEIQTKPQDEKDKKQQLNESATFILIRTRTKNWKLDDEEMVHRYSQQWRCEHGFAWLKSSAAINPMYVEKETRIASLCYIYTLALMVQTLTQRSIRNYLKTNNTELPYHRNKPSKNITTRFYYYLFRGLSTQKIKYREHAYKKTHGYNDTIELALKALGASETLYKPDG